VVFAENFPLSTKPGCALVRARSQMSLPLLFLSYRGF